MSTKLLQLQDQSLNPKPSPATTKESKTGGSSEPARARSGSRGWRGGNTLPEAERTAETTARAAARTARAGRVGRRAAASAPRGPRARPRRGPRRRRAGGSRSPAAAAGGWRRRSSSAEISAAIPRRRGSPIGGGALERQRVRIDRPRGARVLLTLLLQVFVLERERRERKRERRDGRGEEERRATMMTKSLVASTGVGVKVFSLFLFPTVRFLL